MKSKTDAEPGTGVDTGRGDHAEQGRERLRIKIASLERTCRVLHSAEVHLWDTVEHLREGLGAWLAYPDVDVQERAGDMLALIEETLDRVVQRRTVAPLRGVPLLPPDLGRRSESRVALELADED